MSDIKRWMALVNVTLTIVLMNHAGSGGADEILSTEKLIEQLGSKEFDEREKADQMLLARGPTVLPAVRKALSHSDAEVRRRVQALIPRLMAAAALEPKCITLNADQKPLSAILKEIEKQTGYALSADSLEAESNYSLALQRVPFWEALERIGHVTGRTVNLELFEKGIQLKRRAGRSPYVVVSGPFRLEATRFHEDRDIFFTETGKNKEIGRRDHLLTLTVSVLAEPRFILLGTGKARVEVAIDEDQKPLVAVPTDEDRKKDVLVISLRESLREDFQHSSEILLQRSSEKAKTIKVLRGTIPVNGVVERKRVVVSEKVLESKGTKCRIGSDTLEIMQASKTEGGDYQFSIAVPSPRGGIDVRWWHQRVHLEDSKGNQYKTCGQGTHTFGDNHEIMLQYAESKDPTIGPPSKLIIEEWIILQHSVPFEFKGVPLP